MRQDACYIPRLDRDAVELPTRVIAAAHRACRTVETGGVDGGMAHRACQRDGSYGPMERPAGRFQVILRCNRYLRRIRAFNRPGMSAASVAGLKLQQNITRTSQKSLLNKKRAARPECESHHAYIARVRRPSGPSALRVSVPTARHGPRGRGTPGHRTNRNSYPSLRVRFVLESREARRELRGMPELL